MSKRPPGEPKTVLIVDDDPRVLEVLTEYFRAFKHRHAYAVSTARDGAEAIMVLLRGQFDLILLDMRMPRMGGLEMLKQIHSLGVRVPVIMISGNQTTQDATLAINAGVFAFLPKPFDAQYLDHLVALALPSKSHAAGPVTPSSP